jgi:hypothetical protein
MMEIWKTVEGLDEYQISNLGNVKSFRLNKSGKAMIARKSQRYLMVKMRGKDKKIHRLVAETFIPNPDNKPQINHIDGNRHNNHCSNLEWVDTSENYWHAMNLGLIPRKFGEANPAAKLTATDVMIIREVWAKFGKGSQVQMCKYYNVGGFIIGAICTRKRWKHI